MSRADIASTKPLAESTRSHYDSAWKRFADWREEQPAGRLSGVSLLPTAEADVMLFLRAECKKGISPSSLNVFLAAIKWQNSVYEDDEIGKSKGCNNIVANYRREYAAARVSKNEEVERQAPPIRPAQLSVLMQSIGSPPRVLSAESASIRAAMGMEYCREARDSAMFALMWAGALRVSEVVALRAEDVIARQDAEGRDYYLVSIRRSKGDQFCVGKSVAAYDMASDFGGVGFARRMRWWLLVRAALCAKDKRWREDGPLFGMKSRMAVHCIVKMRAEVVGIDATTHSFRVGFAVTMAERGKSPALLQSHMRHSNPATTSRYYKNADPGTVGGKLAEL